MYYNKYLKYKKKYINLKEKIGGAIEFATSEETSTPSLGIVSTVNPTIGVNLKPKETVDEELGTPTILVTKNYCNYNDSQIAYDVSNNLIIQFDNNAINKKEYIIDNYWVILNNNFKYLNKIIDLNIDANKAEAENEIKIYDYIKNKENKFSSNNIGLLNYFNNSNIDKIILLLFCNIDNDIKSTNIHKLVLDNKNISLLALKKYTIKTIKNIFLDLGRLFNYLIFTCFIILKDINILYYDNDDKNNFKIYIVNFENSILNENVQIDHFEQILNLEAIDDIYKDEFKKGFNYDKALLKLFNIK